jgi:ribonuclease HI
MFLINCMTKWIDGWKRNGWMTSTSKPVINKDDLARLDDLLNQVSIF